MSYLIVTNSIEMKKGLIIFLILSLSYTTFSQLKEYDLVQEFSNHTKEKPVIVYLCATWCHPCMDKLIPILDSFGNNDQYELVILFDKWIFSKKTFEKLQLKYNTEKLCRFISSKYYSQKKKLIEINAETKAIKNLTADYNNHFTPKLKAVDDIWFGYPIILKNGQVSIANYSNKQNIVSEIRKLL